ncbi:ArdC family protein [Methylobacterium segetis]|uniref:ArdC family protein n=1 Tax=Methylobacterium segetis TaxID=2488750 RepID=UPI00104A6E24|nr:zincin-like metallopeptidase domain-containing protein [Methylobacterium segetis]
MADPHARVTAAILRQLESADPTTWVCPWHRAAGGLPRNAVTRRAYRGINTLALWCAGQERGYADPRWATYRQWSEQGAQVRRGEQGTAVLFYRDLPPEAAGETSTEEADAPRFVARASTVFNAAQVDSTHESPTLPVIPIDPIPAFDRFVAATGAVIRTGVSACYLPARDEIRLPERAAFRSAAGYCGTLAHELVHWTGAPHRLDRRLTTRFATRAYAAEELVAELGAAFVLAGLGLAPEPHPNHAAYMAGWLPLVRDEPRALATAASLASRAAQYLEAFAQPVGDAMIAA